MPHPNSKRAKAAKAKRKIARAEVDKSAPDYKEHLVQSEQRQADKLLQRRRKAAAKKRRTYSTYAIAALVVIGGSWLLFRPGPELVGVERPQNDGRGHVANASFGDSTPTSGAHSASAPACGTYPSPLSLDLAVHALEHGTVVLWFDQASPNLASELEDVMAEWDSHVIVSPSADLEAPVVATAWNRRLEFSEAGQGVADFVDTYRKRGPESVRCDIP